VNCPSHGLVAHPIKLNVRRRSEKVDNTRMKAVRMVKVDMSGWPSKHIDEDKNENNVLRCGYFDIRISLGKNARILNTGIIRY